MRLAIGTNHIDSGARHGHITGIQALRRVQGTHRWTFTFDDIAAADALLLVGTNITEANPITGLRVKDAVKKRGASLVTVESLEPAVDTISNIANLAQHHFSALPGRHGNVILGLIKALVEQHLVDEDLLREAGAYNEALVSVVHKLNWEAIERSTGRPRTDLEEAAQTLAKAKKLVVLVGADVLRHPGAPAVMANLLDLLILTGRLMQPGCGLGALAEENNDQGAVEMGAVAEFWPGATESADRAALERLSQLWHEDLPQQAGASLTEMLQLARDGRLKAMFVVGENPVGTLPPAAHSRDALASLDLLVVQELFPTETTELAHVVLPASSYAEKNGTFTNSEGHVQTVRQAIDPVGESRPDWEIESALSILMGYPLEYGSAREILKGIREVIPGYGLLGPAPTPPKVDPAVLRRYLSEGYASDLPARYTLTVDASQTGTPLVFGQSLFHSGKLSTKAKGLLEVQSSGVLRMNPEDAARLGLVDGDPVRLANGQGQGTATVSIKARVPSGMVWFPEHFNDALKPLVNWSVDPLTKVPYCRLAHVSIEKVR
jgi:formate dehydrogenase alpha subunit